MTVSSVSAWTGLQQSVETVLQLLNEEPSLGAIVPFSSTTELSGKCQNSSSISNLDWTEHA